MKKSTLKKMLGYLILAALGILPFVEVFIEKGFVYGIAVVILTSLIMAVLLFLIKTAIDLILD